MSVFAASRVFLSFPLLLLKKTSAFFLSIFFSAVCIYFFFSLSLSLSLPSRLAALANELLMQIFSLVLPRLHQ